MENSISKIGRNISILDRLMKMYYDRGLKGTKISWGQQFFLEYIYDHPGTTPQEMADFFRVDKATVTKTLKKLMEISYINIEQDKKDKRIHHLYIRDEAIPSAEKIKSLHQQFYKDIFENFSPSDIQHIEKQTEEMIKNINKKIWHRMERN